MTRVYAFVERDLRLALSTPLGLVMPFFSILVTVAGFAFLSRLIDRHAALDTPGTHVDYFTYVVVNLAFMLLFNQALQAVSNAVRRDQVAGTLEPIVASTAPLPILMVGSTLWPMLFTTLQVAAYLGCAAFFGLRLGHIDTLAFAVFTVGASLCMAALGMFGAALVIGFRQTPPSALLVGSSAALLTGVLFPVSLLPWPLQMVSWLLPLTHALRGVRASLLGAPLASVASDALWLAVATAILVPLGLVSLRLALTRAKIEGTLSSY